MTALEPSAVRAAPRVGGLRTSGLSPELRRRAPSVRVKGGEQGHFSASCAQVMLSVRAFCAAPHP
eukprot:57012-Eustigmatos_ZCMA.PRE.2